jgi:hypothetical protein
MEIKIMSEWRGLSVHVVEPGHVITQPFGAPSLVVTEEQMQIVGAKAFVTQTQFDRISAESRKTAEAPK